MTLFCELLAGFEDTIPDLDCDPLVVIMGPFMGKESRNISEYMVRKAARASSKASANCELRVLGRLSRSFRAITSKQRWQPVAPSGPERASSAKQVVQNAMFVRESDRTIGSERPVGEPHRATASERAIRSLALPLASLALSALHTTFAATRDCIHPPFFVHTACVCVCTCGLHSPPFFQAAFRNLRECITRFKTVSLRCKFLLIPSLSETPCGAMMPQSPLPQILMKEMEGVRVTSASNPARVDYRGKELCFYNNDSALSSLHTAKTAGDSAKDISPTQVRPAERDGPSETSELLLPAR